jgi:fatty acyl-CoA reductase
MAATVNFNERLRFAVDINVLGAKRIVDLGLQCTQLRALVHTSTCYVNCIRKTSDEIREKIYPIQFDATELVEQLVAMSPEEADAATAEIIRPHPNTYTFTKFLAEHVCAEARGSLPYAIVRPSIIGAALEFPVPGWVDSFIGPAGLMAASGLGALHCMIGDGGAVCDLVPVDLVAHKLLVAAWHTARSPKIDSVSIFHASTGTSNPYLWDELRTAVNGHFWRRPLSKRVMPNYAMFSRSPLLFKTIQTATSTLPAAVSDLKLRAQGKAPKFVRQMRALDRIVKSLSFFTSYPWRFSNHNSLALNDAMSSTDAVDFPIDPRRIHWELYVVYMCEGVRYYLLKEPRPADYVFKPHAKL